MVTVAPLGSEGAEFGEEANDVWASSLPSLLPGKPPWALGASGVMARG